MIAYTLRNVVKCLQEYGGQKQFKLTLRDKKARLYHQFYIHNKSVIWSRGKTLDFEMKEAVDNIQTLILPKRFEVVMFEELATQPNGELFEKNVINVKYEGQLFVKIFRILRDRVSFTILHGGKYIDCYHIDGKVMYIEETENRYKVIITDLFKLNRTYPDYVILTINGLMSRYSFRAFLEEHSDVAKKLGKVFEKHSDNSKI